MVKFLSVAVIAAVALATSTSPVEAQNAAVHAADITATELRTANEAKAQPAPAPAPKAPGTKPAVAPAPAPAPAPKAPGTKPAVAPAPAPAPAPKAPGTKPAVAPAPAPAPAPKAPGTPPASAPAPAPAPAPKAPGTPPAVAPAPAPAPGPSDAEGGSSTWVENKIVAGQIKSNPLQKACYRRISVTTSKSCPRGYTLVKGVSCWSQCPLDYPVQCGFECLPQNKDCTLAIASKVSSVATSALTGAVGKIFKKLVEASSGAIACGQGLFDVVSRISTEVDKLTAGKRLTTKDQFKQAILSIDFVLFDVPVAITTCLGIPLPSDYKDNKSIVKKVEKIVVDVVDKKFEKHNPADPKNFINFYKSFKEFWGTDTAANNKTELPELSPADVTQIAKASTECGGMLKDYFIKVRQAVTDFLNKKPEERKSGLEEAILALPLVLEDLPKATVNCWKSNAPDGAKTRSEIITMAQVMTEQLINTAKEGTKNALKTAWKYRLEVAQFALDTVAIFEPTGIASMIREFLQPICPVTEFKGLIEKGTLDKALGLETVSAAFKGSTGTWEPEGDGFIYFRFKSSDTEEIYVNIISGGEKKYSWALKPKQSWQKELPLKDFADKTLYIDRWRPGIFNFWGAGGNLQFLGRGWRFSSHVGTREHKGTHFP